MEKVYILKEDLNRWVAKYFDKDLITINDLISVIENLDEELDSLKEKFEDYIKEQNEEHEEDPYDVWMDHKLMEE